MTAAGKMSVIGSKAQRSELPQAGPRHEDDRHVSRGVILVLAQAGAPVRR
jgi:hypothetical protein